MLEVEVWVIVDENGEVFASGDYEEACEKCRENSTCLTRTVRVTIKLPTPAPTEVTAELPAESNECSVSVR